MTQIRDKRQHLIHIAPEFPVFVILGKILGRATAWLFMHILFLCTWIAEPEPAHSAELL